MIDTRKRIAVTYILTWFVIDVVAIIPFNLLFEWVDFSSLLRFSKIARVGKLFKMMRLMRLLKIFKERDKMAGYLNEFFKFNDAMERLFLFCVSFLLITHIVTCVWVMITQISSGPDNWIYRGDY